MKRISLAAACFIFAAIFAVSASAQGANPAAAGAGKIGIIVVEEFGAEKGGITKYKTVMTALDAEFKPINDKLRAAATRYQTLGQEIEKLRSASTASGPPINQNSIQTKVDEFQNLEKQIKRDQEDARA